MQLQSSRFKLVLLFFAFTCFLLGTGWLRPACAATFTVTSTTDVSNGGDGVTTLREALTATTLTGEADVIQFDGTVFANSQTITLTQGELGISSDVTINGPGARKLTIDANQASRVFNITAGTVTINDLSVANGRLEGQAGGGILNEQTLTLNRCTVKNNQSIGNFGSGIASVGNLTIDSCTIINNTGALVGGGVWTRGTLAISNSTVAGNSGSYAGGIYQASNASGTATVTSSTVAYNTADDSRGILNDGSATFTLTNTIVAANILGPSPGPRQGDLGGAFVNGGYNFIGIRTGSTGITSSSNSQTGTTTAPLNALLNPLGNNGGTTDTIAPKAGSPVLDKGNSPLTTDGRGLARPYNIPQIANAPSGNASDIGAVEVQAAEITNYQNGPNFVVNSTADDAGCTTTSCTLRGALQTSNEVGGNNTVTFAPAVFGTTPQTINLSSALPIDNNVTITGPAVGLTLVAVPFGNIADRVLAIGGVKTNMLVSISDLTFRDSQTPFSSGGAIYNFACNLTLTRCTFINNKSGNNGGGGAIFNGGGLGVSRLTLLDCTFDGNSTGSNSRGGAVYNFQGTATITNCTFRNNISIMGGAVANNGGILTATGCSFSENRGDNGGGAIYSHTDAALSTLTAVRNCTLSGNSAPGTYGGGGLYNENGPTQIENCTITGNTALTGLGSGFSAFSDSSTFTQIKSSIIAGNVNSDFNLRPDGYQPANFTSNGYNLIGSGSQLDRFNAPGDRTGVTAAQLNLGALQVIAPGKTAVRPLLSGSIAIDAGQSSLPTDQRGLARPFDVPGVANAPGGDGSDVGAYEAYLPVVDLNRSNNVVFTEDGGPRTLLDSSANLGYVVSGTTYSSATITLDATPDGSSEALAANTNGTPLTVNYNGDARTLTIGGNGTPAQYLQVLKTVTYNNTSQNPNASTRTATFTIVTVIGTASTTAVSDATTTNIAVVPVNDAPVSLNQNLSIPEGVTQPITLGATDIDSATLSYSIVLQPQHGRLSGSGANLSYTPDSNYSGPDAFTFRASDGAATSNEATVAINVTDVLHAPVAQNDAYTVTGLTPLTVNAPGVLGNDTDADNDTLHAVIVGQPAHGTLVLNDNGSFTYTPEFGYNGVDDFTYRAADAVSQSGLATVSLTVSGNIARTLSLRLSNQSVAEGATLSGTLTLSRPAPADVTVTLSSSNAAAAAVPASVTIPAGQTSAFFLINAPNNPAANATQDVTITAATVDYGSASASLTVTGNFGRTLSLQLSDSTVSEGSSVAGTITLSRPAATAVAVTLVSNNPATRVPATVTIAAGQTSAFFTVTAPKNPLATGTQSAAITATLADYGSAAASLTVTDNEVATLSLVVAPATFNQNAGPAAAIGTVSRNTPTTAALTVRLSSNNVRAAKVPATVVIPAGAASSTFYVAAVDDRIAGRSSSVVIKAGSAGYKDATATVTVEDNGRVTRDLKLGVESNGLYTEGTTRATGTLTLPGAPLTSDLTITLVSSEPRRIALPRIVVLRKGQSSVNFTFTIADDRVADGPHKIWLTALSLGYGTSAVQVTVQDNDGPILTLALARPSVLENARTLTGTITRRNVATTGAVTVALKSSDITRATVPASVVIPAGRPSATFTITIKDNTKVEGTKRVILTAASANLVGTSANLDILDNDVAAPVRAVAPVQTVPVKAEPTPVKASSSVRLSVATYNALGVVQLAFTGALDADAATGADTFTVRVNGVPVAVESLSYVASVHTAKLLLAEGAVKAGDVVDVTWSGLLDARGTLVPGQARVTVR